MEAVDALTRFGLGGVVIALFVLGLIVSKREHDRVIAERDRVWDRSDVLADDIHGAFTEAIQEATRAIKAREEFEDRIYEVLVDVRRLLEGRQP